MSIYRARLRNTSNVLAAAVCFLSLNPTSYRYLVDFDNVISAHLCHIKTKSKTAAEILYIVSKG